jgi:hypothetical protein
MAVFLVHLVVRQDFSRLGHHARRPGFTLRGYARRDATSSVRSDIAGDEKSVCTDMKCLMNEIDLDPEKRLPALPKGSGSTGSPNGMTI